MSSAFCSVIIVTYNCEKYIRKAMDSLRDQTRLADQVIIIDSGSADTAYLKEYATQPNVTVSVGHQGIGFCRANNQAMSLVSSKADYVFFLNPDAMLTPDFLEGAIDYMEMPENKRVGALTGKVFGYNIDQDKPSGLYDSTGIFQSWYGRWYDRGQGQPIDEALYQEEMSVPAICGAVYFCRLSALKTILLRGSEVFDSTFFMYKDDIDLSLRLRNSGWDVKYVPSLVAYHCRGWNPDRSKMPRVFRLYSAWNELRIHARQGQPVPVAYSFCKYAAVKLLDK